MEQRDAMIHDDEIHRFVQEIIDCIVRHGGVDPIRAKEIYAHSIIPGGLEEAPSPYLHESPYYWAMYLLTGDEYVSQIPPDELAPEVERFQPDDAMTWKEVQRFLCTSALPVRSINWKGKAESPEAAWIITTLDGPGNKLERPDRMAGEEFRLSDEKVDQATRRMLREAGHAFPLYLFLRIPEKPVRYWCLGLGKVIGYQDAPAYPHWQIKLEPLTPAAQAHSGA